MNNSRSQLKHERGRVEATKNNANRDQIIQFFFSNTVKNLEDDVFLPKHYWLKDISLQIGKHRIVKKSTICKETEVSPRVD